MLWVFGFGIIVNIYLFINLFTYLYTGLWKFESKRLSKLGSLSVFFLLEYKDTIEREIMQRRPIKIDFRNMFIKNGYPVSGPTW